MVPRRMTGQDFTTLEGPDRNALGAAEALARDEFARPENLEQRRHYWKTLFQVPGSGSVRPAHPPATSPPKVA
jgi:hypothetical protein